MGSFCCTPFSDTKDDEKIALLRPHTNSKFCILQIGTFPWQSINEPTSGSGILHEAHHKAINSIDGYTSYSIWPSIQQKNNDLSDNRIRIYEVDKFPRFYAEPKYSTVSNAFITEYTQKLENLIYEYIIDIETKFESKNGVNGSIQLIICHHPFFNVIMISNVMKKRKKNGLSVPIIASFIHGSVLKIYQYELDKNNCDYSSSFYKQISSLNLFESNKSITGNIDLIYSISSDVTNIFFDFFPKFKAKNVVYCTPGYNPIFKKIDGLTLNNVLNESKLKHIGLNNDNDDNKNYIGDNKNYKYMIMFAGSLVEMKRIEVLLYAAAKYEKKYNDDILTLIVGRQLEPHNTRLQKLNTKLNNKNVYFVGPKQQDILVKLYNVANSGVFPSQNEPFGMVFIECLACGTPVIGANSGGPVDFVDDSVGKLVDENNDNQILGDNFANAIINSIQNNDKLKKSNVCVKVAAPYAVRTKVKTMLINTRQLYKL